MLYLDPRHSNSDSSGWPYREGKGTSRAARAHGDERRGGAGSRVGLKYTVHTIVLSSS